MAETDDTGQALATPSYLFEVANRRRWTVVTIIMAAIVAVCIFNETTVPIYSASTLILIEKEAQKQTATDASVGETTASDYYQTQYHLLKSRSLLKQVYADLELAEVEEFSGGVDALAAALGVYPLPRSRLVDISIKSENGELAARISNKVAQIYVTQNLKNKLFISKEILDTLNEQFDLQKGIDEKYNALPAVVDNRLIQELKGAAARLDIDWGELSSRYTPEHPERKRLKAQRKAIEDRIREETIRAVRGMKAELSGQLMGNNVRIVDPAEPPGAPTSPNKRRNIMLGATAGLMLGILVAFIFENFDQSIHTQDEIERKLGMPFLGAVSKSEGLKGETAVELYNLLSGPDSFSGEAFKNIRTMVGLSSAGKPIRNLLVTSSVQGEGKTYLSINLALVLAQLGGKVLLIEGDLRRPNLHKRFGLSNEKGLSHFLAYAQNLADLPALIQDTNLSGLKVLVCGHIPPNPAELLNTPRIKGLIEWVGKEFDHVVIDGTPVFPITDVLLWGKEVDAAVFVVQFGGVAAGLIIKAKQKLLESGVRISGAVINQVTAKGQSNYGDYYHQYHYYYTRNAAKKKNV